MGVILGKTIIMVIAEMIKSLFGRSNSSNISLVTKTIFLCPKCTKITYTIFFFLMNPLLKSISLERTQAILKYNTISGSNYNPLHTLSLHICQLFLCILVL